MRNLRVSTEAVARTLLQHLEAHKKLNRNEEQMIMYALKNCGVDKAPERIIAELSRGTIKTLLNQG